MQCRKRSRKLHEYIAGYHELSQDKISGLICKVHEFKISPVHRKVGIQLKIINLVSGIIRTLGFSFQAFLFFFLISGNKSGVKIMKINNQSIAM